jgi:hypothetical protein
MENESNELVQKIVERDKIEVYQGIEKNLYELSIGIPSYINILLSQNIEYERAMKKKNFTSKEELKKVFFV